MRIGEVARRSGVSVKTIRYYEQLGILDPPRREPNGYRSYGPAVVDRLAFIRAGQTVGLTLGEIGEILAFREHGQPPCTHVLGLIQRHADDLTRRIGELEQMRSVLETLAARGRILDPARCRPETICHVIPSTSARGFVRRG